MGGPTQRCVSVNAFDGSGGFRSLWDGMVLTDDGLFGLR